MIDQAKFFDPSGCKRSSRIESQEFVWQAMEVIGKDKSQAAKLCLPPLHRRATMVREVERSKFYR